MLSMWKVREIECCGDIFFQVYRMTDAARRVDRIETAGGYFPTRAEAEAYARRRNTEGAIL